MSDTLLTTRSLPNIGLSRNGRYLAATDAHRYLYVADLASRKIILEKQLLRPIVQFDFDRVGTQLFLHDGLYLDAFQLPKFIELPMPLEDVMEEPEAVTFLDSNSSGEILVVQGDGDLYLIDSDENENRSRLVCTAPIRELRGWFLQPQENRLVLTSMGPKSRSTILDISGTGSPDVIPSLQDWLEGEVMQVADDGRHAVVRGTELIVRDRDLAEVSSCEFPAIVIDSIVAVSPELQFLAAILHERIEVYNTTDGELVVAMEFEHNPAAAVFYRRAAAPGLKLIYALCNGAIIESAIDVQGKNGEGKNGDGGLTRD